MLIELIGQQIWVRLRDPRTFKSDSYKTQKMSNGKISIIWAESRVSGERMAQSVRLNLSQMTATEAYSYLEHYEKEGYITEATHRRGVGLVKRWWNSQFKAAKG